LLDVIVQGSDADQGRARELLREDPRPRALWPLSKEIDHDEKPRSSARLYVAVIGFYTDIKIGIVLTGLPTRYELPNLAVSDTFRRRRQCPPQRIFPAQSTIGARVPSRRIRCAAVAV
jgi:hypothetical protein